MSEVRWGILSTADIGLRAVIPALQKARRSRVVAIGSRDHTRAQATATNLGIASAYGSYEEVLADDEVDAVYIPVPNHLHLEWTLRAAAAGKHVLCEKPLALNSADAQRMVDACSSAGLRLAEAFMYRTHPLWQAVFELVRSGRLGSLTGVQSWFSYFNDNPGNIRNIAEYGGGALYDIGCYCINLSRILFGDEPTTVRASVIRDDQNATDTTTSAILEFAGGTASFVCSTRAADDQRVHIHGTNGWIHIPIPFNIPDDRPSEIWLYDSGTPGAATGPQQIEFATADSYVTQAETFIASVIDGVDPPFGPDDAVANMRVIEQVFAAAEGPGA